jgi:hypothetical protein
MIIFKDDADDGLDPLPVRKGCWGGPCACSGSCLEIIGEVPRKEYLDFVDKFISVEDWIKKNMKKKDPPSRSEKEYTIHLRTNPTIRTKLAEKKLGFKWNPDTHKIKGIENLAKFFNDYCAIDKDAEIYTWPKLDEDESDIVHNSLRSDL